ncbi:MAG: phosphatase [Rothia sp. (in: high G+C Gram-positive bacteria)]|nr:phosphatase [Rothia sp. (in: high G+C Gram-positive bacteria)]
MSDQEFAQYLDRVKITGQVATPREVNLKHMRGFVAGLDHLEFGVRWTRPWSFEDVLELMARRVGSSPDPDFVAGVDTISAQLCIAALKDYARIFGQAVAQGKSLLFATGHPAGLFPIYAQLAQAAQQAGAQLLTIQEGQPFLDGDIRQIMGVVMCEQYGSLQHTHLPGAMELVLAQLEQKGLQPDLVIADHGFAGYAASAGLATVGIADCNDPGLFVAAEQGQLLVAVPMDDNVTPHLYQPLLEFILTQAGLL